VKLKWHILCVAIEDDPYGVSYLECGECGWHLWMSNHEAELAQFDLYQFWGDTHMAEVYRAYQSGRAFVP
jgi:hypothetical protein